MDVKEVKKSERESISEKISCSVYKGILYADIILLPEHQRQMILSWGGLRTIKIKTETTVLINCIQYRDYEKWYHDEYEPRIAQEQL